MFIVHVISCYLLAAMIRTMIPAQDLDTVDAYLTLPYLAQRPQVQQTAILDLQSHMSKSRYLSPPQIASTFPSMTARVVNGRTNY